MRVHIRRPTRVTGSNGLSRTLRVGGDHLASSRGSRVKGREKGGEGKSRNGEHLLRVLRLHRPGEHRRGGAVGALPQPRRPWPSLLQPLRRRVPCRRSLHPRLLARRPRGDQDQGPCPPPPPSHLMNLMCLFGLIQCASVEIDLVRIFT